MSTGEEYVPLLSNKFNRGICNRKVALKYFFALTALFILVMIAVSVGLAYGRCKKDTITPSNGVSEVQSVPVPTQPVAPDRNYRLPTSLVPVNYRISLQPYLPSKAQFDPNKVFYFDGNSSVVFTCEKPADNLTLHGFNLTLHDYWLTENGEMSALLPRDHKQESFDQVTSQYVFRFEENCRQGSNYEFHARYTGYLADDLQGLQKLKYTDQGEQRWLAVTHFESTRARRIAPMFDEPGMKATWQISVIHPAEMIALSNMRISDEQMMEVGWKKTSFFPTIKTSSYLLAIFVGDYVSIDAGQADTAKKTNFHVYSRHDFIEQTKWAGYAGPKVLSFYEKYLDIEFPLDKLDLIALPEYVAGATENWGLITFREESLLYDPRYHAPTVKMSTGTTIAHEISHQWFGNLVTMDWWSDIWLSESFAAFFQWRGVGEISDHQWNTEDRFVINDRHSAMEFDQRPSSHPLSKDVQSTDEIGMLFDTISYDKGASVLTMLNHTIGPKLFLEGLQYYLNTYAFEAVNHQQLFDSWQTVIKDKGVIGWDGAPLDITAFMNRWVMQMGFPVINVKRSNDVLHVSQSRFLLENKTKSEASPYNYQWYTPLWYLNRTNDVSEMIWLEEEKPIIISGPAFASGNWYLINPKAYGYYRVNYDAKNWRQLHVQLLTDPTPISISARGQLLDDSFTLALAGNLPYDYALNLTCYLGSEHNFIPWAASTSNLAHIGQMLALTESYGSYTKYMLKLLNEVYPHIAIFDRSVSDNDQLWYDLQTNTMAHACKYGQPECVEYAKRTFQEYRTNCSQGLSSNPECNGIPPNLRQTIYCTAVAELGTPAFDFVFEKQIIETVNTEALSLLRGLTCAQQPWLLTRFLKATVTGQIQRSHVRTAYRALPSNVLTSTGLVWNWVAENWDWIMALLGVNAEGRGDVAYLLDGATANFNREYQYSMVRDFEKNHPDLDTVMYPGLSLKNVLSKIRTNINWMDKHQKNVVNWLLNQSTCSI